MRRIAAGHSNQAIAGQLGLSVPTVETAKARAWAPLSLMTGVEIVRHAVQQCWPPGAG